MNSPPQECAPHNTNYPVVDLDLIERIDGIFYWQTGFRRAAPRLPLQALGGLLELVG